jgi:1,2-dihydroxy-3-keto-5-methylthiopentene dioxygenase
MAILQASNGNIYRDLKAIVYTLGPLNISLRYFELSSLPLSKNLLERDILEPHEKQQVIELHKNQLSLIARESAYTWCDLLIVHPGSPNLQTLMLDYSRYHIHASPEAMYVLSGEAIFGFIQPDGTQVQLLVQPGDYLQIPSQLEHWFSPMLLSLKAIRCFSTANSEILPYTSTDADDSLQNQP